MISCFTSLIFWLFFTGAKKANNSLASKSQRKQQGFVRKILAFLGIVGRVRSGGRNSGTMSKKSSNCLITFTYTKNIEETKHALFQSSYDSQINKCKRIRQDREERKANKSNKKSLNKDELIEKLWRIHNSFPNISKRFHPSCDECKY
ncbi:unnamed protein product [Moneuplotes crassus]|uniref:Uncharacterized protein n=1 Tax=Euplotes crassus TaxID=5936 RepID=A0AAD1XDK1_EUPCR|nr:unnamed protein product [Moneuplotes crassus]